MLDLQVQLSFNRAMQDGLLRLAQMVAGQNSDLQQIEVATAERALPLLESLTPYITTSLRSAEAVFVPGQDTFIGLNPSARNAESSERPFDYGPLVHERGGLSTSGHRRAFMDEFVNVYGEDMLLYAENLIMLVVNDI